jgi:hypothetical protein
LIHVARNSYRSTIRRWRGPRGKDHLPFLTPGSRLKSRARFRPGDHHRFQISPVVANLASCSRFVQDLFSHEHVAHSVTSIEFPDEGELGVRGQPVTLLRFLAKVICPIQRVLHRQPHPNPTRMMHVTQFSGSCSGQVFLAILNKVAQ